MAKTISVDDVNHLSKLINTPLKDNEISKISEMLTDTLEYMDTLNELDTKNVHETFQVTGLTNVFQKDDEKSTTLSKKESLSNASDEIDGLFGTKAVFER